MNRALGWLSAIAILTAASSASAISIDLTLDMMRDLDTVTFTIGMMDTGGQDQSINGYTLAWEFDPTQIQLQDGGAIQLVSFGSMGVLPFPEDCELDQRCTAGNIPTYDSDPVGDLFSLIFDIVDLGPSEMPQFLAGILDDRFDGITQPTGQPIFDIRTPTVPVVHGPEPGASVLLGVALLLGAIVGRPRKAA